MGNKKQTAVEWLIEQITMIWQDKEQLNAINVEKNFKTNQMKHFLQHKKAQLRLCALGLIYIITQIARL